MEMRSLFESAGLVYRSVMTLPSSPFIAQTSKKLTFSSEKSEVNLMLPWATLRYTRKM